jgi:hypothetical protein
MFTNHIDMSQAFTEGELQPDDDYLGNFKCTLVLLPVPLRILPMDISSGNLSMTCPVRTHAWFQTMSTFLKKEDYTKVVYEEITYVQTNFPRS